MIIHTRTIYNFIYTCLVFIYLFVLYVIWRSALVYFNADIEIYLCVIGVLFWIFISFLIPYKKGLSDRLKIGNACEHKTTIKKAVLVYILGVFLRLLLFYLLLFIVIDDKDIPHKYFILLVLVICTSPLEGDNFEQGKRDLLDYSEGN